MNFARVTLLIALLFAATAARAEHDWQPRRAERGLFFVLPRLPDLDIGAGWLRFGGLTLVGTLAAVAVTRASFFVTCPELARNADASNPGCKAGALISTALLAPPAAIGTIFAIGWLTGRHETLTGTLIGGSIGTAVGLLSWIIPMSTSTRTVMLPLFSALGAAAGFEIAFDPKRAAPPLIVGFTGDRLMVAGAF